MSGVKRVREAATQFCAARWSAAGWDSGSLAYHCTVKGERRHGNAVAPAATRATAPPSGSQIACRSPDHALASATAATRRPIPAPDSQGAGRGLPATKDSRVNRPASESTVATWLCTEDELLSGVLPTRRT